jgi:hypothetical protein
MFPCIFIYVFNISIHSATEKHQDSSRKATRPKPKRNVHPEPAAQESRSRGGERKVIRAGATTKALSSHIAFTARSRSRVPVKESSSSQPSQRRLHRRRNSGGEEFSRKRADELGMYVGMYVCMYVCMDGWMDGWMYFEICMYVYMYVCFLSISISSECTLFVKVTQHYSSTPLRRVSILRSLAVLELPVCMHLLWYVCMYVCMYVCTYVFTYVCMYVCVYVRKCVSMYIYVWKLFHNTSLYNLHDTPSPTSYSTSPAPRPMRRSRSGASHRRAHSKPSRPARREASERPRNRHREGDSPRLKPSRSAPERRPEGERRRVRPQTPSGKRNGTSGARRQESRKSGNFFDSWMDRVRQWGGPEL